MIPVFIIARAKSERLPGKHFLEFGGRTVIEHMVKRCEHFNLEPRVAVPLDDVVTFFNHVDRDYLMGGSIDPAARCFECAKRMGITEFHMLDGDDLFFDASEVKRSFEYMQDNALHCVLPSKTSANGAALMGYSYSTRLGEVKILPEGRAYPLIRMTLDYPEDYWFLRTLVRRFDYRTERRSLDFMIDTMSLTSINDFRTKDWREKQIKEGVA